MVRDVKLVDRERRPTPLVTRSADLAAIAAHLHGAVGGDCAVTFEFVEDISPEPSGKYRATLSLVARGEGEGA